MKQILVTLALATPAMFFAATADAQYDDVRQRAACAAPVADVGLRGE